LCNFAHSQFFIFLAEEHFSGVATSEVVNSTVTLIYPLRYYQHFLFLTSVATIEFKKIHLNWPYNQYRARIRANIVELPHNGSIPAS